ncbi:MAG: hypothetical protein QME41_06735 [Actinomycetota bacterium]|nr:hypothetical protein [Actinomycetota bacterium]
MAIKPKVIINEAKLEDGVYDAKIEGVELLKNQETPWGVTDKLKLVLSVEGIELILRVNNVLSKKSKLFGIAKAVFKKEPPLDGSFDAEWFIGRKCQALVENSESEQGIWTNISTVLPLRSAQQAQPQAREPEPDFDVPENLEDIVF